MTTVELLLIALALSMDAFAVAVTSGIMVSHPGVKKTVKLALFFGFFQFAMPVIGYLLGISVSSFIESVDHYIAFALLAFIGVRMIIEAVKGDSDAPKTDPFSTKTLLVMAIATSIDALAVGISFALTNVKIIYSSVTIGIVTFILSALGVVLGNKVGSLFQKSASIIGGVILVGIGVKILIEHLIGA